MKDRLSTTKFVNQWELWSNVSTNRKIFSATLIIALFTFGAKLVSTAKELVVAASFGTSDSMDAFLVAFIVPSAAVTIISGSFNAAFIPSYVQVKERYGTENAQKLLGNVMASTILLLGTATIGMVLAAPYYLPLLASGFSPIKIALTRKLLYLLSPMVLIAGTNTIWSAVLNAGEEFALVAATPALTPAVIIVFLFVARGWGVTTLTVGTICGTIFEAGIICSALLRKRIRPWPSWHGADPHLWQVIQQYLPMVSGSLILGSTSLINQGMAAMLGPGSVAVLNYGNRLITVPISVGTTALGTAVIPYFSVMVGKNDWHGIRHTLKRYFALIFGVAIPVTVGLMLGSELLVRVIYQRGAFTTQDTHLVAPVLAFFAVQLPFYVAGTLLVRLVSAMLANHILLISSIVSLLLNVTLNYAFMQRFGVAGIALSTSCVYLVAFLLLHFSWRRISKKYQ